MQLPELIKNQLKAILLRSSSSLTALGKKWFGNIVSIAEFWFKLLIISPLKPVMISTLLLLLALIFALIGCNLWVETQSQGLLYSNVNIVPKKQVALLLGTVPQLSHGRINRYFQYRIDAVVQLYKAGKIKHIIASGDNRSKYYNEPLAMFKALTERGIPKSAITLDYAGLRTLDSVVRCREVFSQEDIVIISQAFHNKRALFISRFYGITAIGFNAEGVPWQDDVKTPTREYFARLKAVLDLYILRTKPKFLGEKVKISI
jgi:SanA protein